MCLCVPLCPPFLTPSFSFWTEDQPTRHRESLFADDSSLMTLHSVFAGFRWFSPCFRSMCWLPGHTACSLLPICWLLLLLLEPSGNTRQPCTFLVPWFPGSLPCLLLAYSLLTRKRTTLITSNISAEKLYCLCSCDINTDLELLCYLSALSPAHFLSHSFFLDHFHELSTAFSPLCTDCS